MWLLFHRKGRTRRVAGGQKLRDHCPACRELVTFHEVEITTGYGVFFIDVIKDSERAFACGACNELFDWKDPSPVADREATRAAERAEAAAAARRQRLAEERAEERRQRAEARAVRIEDELAELKKRLGR
jgi:hypothetical protein